MANRNRRMPADAGPHVWLCYVLLLAITLNGACAKTVIYNKTGRHLVIIIPAKAEDVSIAVPVGQSVELDGAQQQRGVTIQDVQSGVAAGPMDLSDDNTLEAIWIDPSSSSSSSSTPTSTSTTTTTAADPLSAAKLVSGHVSVGNLLVVNVHIP